MMQELHIEDIQVHAYHGCLEEERRIGGKYRIDIKAIADLSAAAEMDDLSKTLDYVAVYNLVCTEMATRSKLIETVAKRIADKLHEHFEWVSVWEVCITKYNPPVGGNLGQCRVVWKLDV